MNGRRTASDAGTAKKKTISGLERVLGFRCRECKAINQVRLRESLELILCERILWEREVERNAYSRRSLLLDVDNFLLEEDKRRDARLEIEQRFIQRFKTTAKLYDLKFEDLVRAMPREIRDDLDIVK
jgi:hypothetical protein